MKKDVIVERKIISEPNAAIEVTEIVLSESARKALNLPPKVKDEDKERG